jgi:hypothetical protein
MIAAAIVTAGVLISASVFIAVGDATRTVTDTSRVTLTDTVTPALPSASTTTITSTDTVTTNSSVGDLVFRQYTPCPNIGYIAPWSVTLSNGQSVTADYGNYTVCCGGSPGNPSIITFLVAKGNYSYSVIPTNLTPHTGTVTVGNQEVVVTLDFHISSCGSSTTSTG